MRLDVFLTNGKFLVVTEDTEKVLDNIVHGKDNFVEIVDKNQLKHFVNVDHIVEVKVILHPINWGYSE